MQLFNGLARASKPGSRAGAALALFQAVTDAVVRSNQDMVALQGAVVKFYGHAKSMTKATEALIANAKENRILLDGMDDRVLEDKYFEDVVLFVGPLSVTSSITARIYTARKGSVERHSICEVLQKQTEDIQKHLTALLDSVIELLPDDEENFTPELRQAFQGSRQALQSSVDVFANCTDSESIIKEPPAIPPWEDEDKPAQPPWETEDKPAQDWSGAE